MKKPIGFDKVNGLTFKVQDHKGKFLKFSIDTGTKENRIWIFGEKNLDLGFEPKYCVWLDFLWNENIVTFEKVMVGQGTFNSKVIKEVKLDTHTFRTKDSFVEEFIIPHITELFWAKVFDNN